MRWVLLLLPLVAGDLPVHCLHSQVVGTWIFYVDKGGHDNSISCGHMMPDRDDDHLDHEVHLSTPNPQTITLDLKEPSVVVGLSGERGHWTMIYDEGFEVTIAGYKYFAFSHYHSSPSGVNQMINDCDRTFVGWYHSVNGTDWGCYYGIKKDAVPLHASLPPRALSAGEKWAKDVDFEHAVTDADPNINEAPSDMQSFLELITKSQNSFQVKYHEHLHGKSYKELQRMMGGSFLQMNMKTRPVHEHTHVHAHSHGRMGNFNASDLPRSWDWRNVNGQNFDSPFKYQGFCGSCYSMATVQMLETRIRIMTNNTRRLVLSSQDAVSCSRYNQGCDGGYPFLVAKYAQDFGGIVPDSCLQYAPGTACSKRCATPSVKVSVSEYYYVGGYYGGCTEGEMMQELYENGPFVSSFNAGSDFMFYSGGVYTQSQVGDSFLELSNEPSKPPRVREWEKTTHSVLLVGYGETEVDGKFWIAKNTWGAQWGESGYFRIRRGTDECAFESMSLAAKPVLIDLAKESESVSVESSLQQADGTGHPTSDKWGEANLIEEEEGQEEHDSSHSLEVNDPALDSTSSSHATSPEREVLIKALDEGRDEDFMKDYPATRHPRETNDMGVPLSLEKHGVAPGHHTNEAEREWNERPAPESLSIKANVEADSHPHHHHHHHAGAAHHAHHMTGAPSPSQSLMENLQLEQGVFSIAKDEFADPADEL